VADTGDYGNFRSEDRAANDFFVERPQIFQGAAAAREDEDVDEFLYWKNFSALTISSRSLRLHAHGKNHEMDVGKAARQDAHDIADGKRPWGD